MSVAVSVWHVECKQLRIRQLLSTMLARPVAS